MTTWICVISNQKQHMLADLRLVARLEMAFWETEIWLKMQQKGDFPPKELLTLLPQHIFWEENGKLFFQGKKTPERHIPKLLWQPIQQAIPLEIPTSALPAVLNGKLDIKLSASQEVRQAAALRMAWQAWQAYVETAPAVRLKALKFALSEREEVLVLGHPLPTLPGQAYWRAGSLLLPAGWELEWQLFADEIAQAIDGDKQMLILMETDGSYQLIPKTALQPAERSAVRRSEP